MTSSHAENMWLIFIYFFHFLSNFSFISKLVIHVFRDVFHGKITVMSRYKQYDKNFALLPYITIRNICQKRACVRTIFTLLLYSI